MKIIKNKSLQKYNTFNVNCTVKELIILEDLSDVYNLNLSKNYFFLGSGSNTLFVNDYYDGQVILNKIKGKTHKEINGKFILLSVKSGENWDDLVKFTVKNNWQGIENLISIPGTVGAAPVQNIGAYGVEIKDVLEKIICFNYKNNKLVELNNDQCKFDYRDSIFKKEYKNDVFIIEVILKLKTKFSVKDYNLEYKGVKEELNAMGISNFDILKPIDISRAISNLRKKKLPDPKKLPNAGSIFKNPIIDHLSFSRIKSIFPDIPFVELDKDRFKLYAAWLIEKAGLRGFGYKGAYVYENQPLVIVNRENATGRDILNLIKIIEEKVYNLFQIKLETEINIIS